MWIGDSTGYASPGQRDTLWILDVDGKRVVIEAVSFPGTSAEDLAAQQQLIDSIRIEPNGDIGAIGYRAGIDPRRPSPKPLLASPRWRRTPHERTHTH